jgi:hypothetical protein
MIPPASIAVAIGLLAASGCAMAQDLYKCKGREGRITYSSDRCDKLGLRDAGEIQDRTTTVPPPRKPARKATEVDRRTDIEDTQSATGTGQVKPVNPLIEKLLK